MSHPTQNTLTFAQALIQKATVKRALIVCSIVGTFLCFINQWEAILNAFQGLNWIKVILTYMVPYCVSSFSSAASYMDCEERHGFVQHVND
jgi:hypothetical protein